MAKISALTKDSPAIIDALTEVLQVGTSWSACTCLLDMVFNG
jgi:hypothetical protein